MSTSSNQLPNGFEALEPFVAFWAADTSFERDARRGASTREQRQAFFAVAKDEVPKALAYLGDKPLSQFNADEKRLMNLILAFPHVTMAEEMLGDAEARHAIFRKEMPITRSPADAW